MRVLRNGDECPECGERLEAVYSVVTHPTGGLEMWVEHPGPVKYLVCDGCGKEYPPTMGEVEKEALPTDATVRLDVLVPLLKILGDLPEEKQKMVLHWVDVGRRVWSSREK